MIKILFLAYSTITFGNWNAGIALCHVCNDANHAYSLSYLPIEMYSNWRIRHAVGTQTPTNNATSTQETEKSKKETKIAKKKGSFQSQSAKTV